eukprot:gnl/TRDRNA2_/TRDRNA2_156575_c1_seq1.p2 gnl/TRDRNA2_/TRDRNA2_156575_c1~~gnl/TRDRNA2_/TRDRNA2_156575_c1_seq1.p2  ORF type:complete len:118 (-),score=8.06 gnl/TRDRNA2_/TRDRNA2_156575_c1_seq1:53-406(-)
MHLVPMGRQPALDPLIVHWAGTGRHRLWLMEGYLGRRFNLTSKGCPRRSLRPGEAKQGFGSRARAARCCKHIQSHCMEGELPEAVTKHDLAYWGCCAWPPVTKEDCIELLGGQQPSV